MVLNLISTKVTLSASRVPIDLTLIGSATRVHLSPFAVLLVNNTPARLRVIVNAVLFIIFSGLIQCLSIYRMMPELLSFLSAQPQISEQRTAFGRGIMRLKV
jgi:hypothetical protein